MEITEVTGKRFELAVERFLRGDTITYEGVGFWKDPRGALVVSSYSDHIHAENSSPAEATAKIARSKQVLESLSAHSSAFAAAVSGIPCRYEFCHDYGQGAVMLASEDRGQITWVDCT